MAITELAEKVLEFPDNFLLIELCGPHDRNLTQVETAHDIQIQRRGNELRLYGEDAAVLAASDVLEALYHRLEAGKGVEEADIDREIRMGSDEVESAAAQMEMFSGGPIEVKTRKKLVEPRTDAQKAYVRALYDNELAFGIGPAGTGKTYLAVAVGVNMFIQGHVDKMILCRPAVEAGERLGFLPGTQEDKVDPYMQPLYEAQNATTMQMKMFLTRLGEGSRMVITGDRSQVDLPRGVQSGLRDAERLLHAIDKISFNYFTAKDVVRHPLVAAIIEAYEADELSG